MHTSALYISISDFHLLILRSIRCAVTLVNRLKTYCEARNEFLFVIQLSPGFNKQTKLEHFTNTLIFAEENEKQEEEKRKDCFMNIYVEFTGMHTSVIQWFRFVFNKFIFKLCTHFMTVRKYLSAEKHLSNKEPVL